jgi:group I intron endonuclease
VAQKDAGMDKIQEGFIYKITSPTGKIYIGSTIDTIERFKHYKNLDCKGQRKLYNSLLRHGYENHTIEIIETCSIGNLFKLERHYGLLFKSMDSKVGLNLRLPSEGDKKAILSEETLNKMRTCRMGDKNHFFGKTHSPETRLKISLNNKGRTAHNKGKTGYKASDEAKRKMAISQAGRTHSEDTKLKMREKSPYTKVILNLETGIYYTGTREAADSRNMNFHTLMNMLRGNKRNKTSLVYTGELNV